MALEGCLSKPWPKALNSFPNILGDQTLGCGFGGELFVGIQHIEGAFGQLAGFERSIGLLAQVLARLAYFIQACLADLADDFSYLDAQPRIDLLQGCPVALEQIPDGHRELASHR